LWPAVVRHTRNKILMILCAAVIIMTPVFRLMSYLIAAKSGLVSDFIYDYTWNSLDGLACGAILSVVLHEYNLKRKTVFMVSLFLMGIAILMEAAGVPLGIMSRQRPLGVALEVVPFQFTFTALLCISLLLGSSSWKAAVTSKSLQFLGRISYGLYLVHLIFDLYTHTVMYFWKDDANTSLLLPLIIRTVVCGGASIGIAFLSRKYFEERFLRLKNRLS
jgi:peptidoglycan/LPS O-acetylase OafA/YrhL